MEHDAKNAHSKILEYRICVQYIKKIHHDQGVYPRISDFTFIRMTKINKTENAKH